MLAATSLLQNLAPSRTTARAGSTALPPLVVETQDFAATYRMRLTITPGTAGFNQFDLRLLDYLCLTFWSRTCLPFVEAERLSYPPGSPFTVTGFPLPALSIGFTGGTQESGGPLRRRQE